VILGNCAIGSDGITTTPANKMANEQTNAKIGRSMKNRITGLAFCPRRASSRGGQEQRPAA
jgi:hypothetical protein